MKKTLTINKAQLPVFCHSPKNLIQIGGRNTGKSNLLARGIDRMKLMPGSVSTLTSASYKQIMSNILPSVLSNLERLGYQKDIHYFVKKVPPKQYKLPYETPLDFEHYITFVHKERSWGISLVSMDRKDTSGRGKNIDFEFTDEFLTFDMDDYNQVVHAANRGNYDRGWEKYGFHHGVWHFSSMPLELKRKKILEFADYYKDEYKIDYIETWQKIVNLQMQLFEITNPKDFVLLYNEMISVKRTIYPRISKKNNLLFMLTNAIENKYGGGFKWMKEQYLTTPSPLLFQIEIMNQVIDKVQDNYYFLDNRHEYKNAHNYTYLDTLGTNFKKLKQDDCRHDSDVLPNKPLILSFDWGGRFSCMNISQLVEHIDILSLPESHFLTNQYLNEVRKTKHDNLKILNVVNEMWIKPKKIIKHLANQFINYYKYHKNKQLVFVKDRHGDLARNNVKSWNNEFMDYLKDAGWKISMLQHPGQEPAHSIVYLLMNNILQQINVYKYPIMRFNADRCKNTLISLKNAEVEEKSKGLRKVKKSEHINSGVDPLHATHFSDSINKLVYTYVPRMKSSLSTSGAIPTRVK